MIDILISLFERDLKKLITELEQYRSEENIWRTDKQIANSAGNLALHLIGNLNTYIGKEIGHTDYVRDRDLEFSQKNVSRQLLLEKLLSTMNVVQQSLRQLGNDDLEKEYPVLVFSEKTTMGYMLVHLATHLAYHLGQVNYHRRLLDV